MGADNKREMAIISDHSFRINNDKYSFLSKKRYSKKQALTLEFMSVSFSICEDKVMKENKQLQLLRVLSGVVMRYQIISSV